MQQVVDYLRANAAHEPSVLVQQLRNAGHDDRSITQAWDAAFPTVAQWPAANQYAAPAGTRELAVTMPARRGMPTWAIALLVIAGLAALGGVVGSGALGSVDSLDRSDSALSDEVAAVVAEETDLSRAEAVAVFERVGGARVEGGLPAGWSELQDGVWGTRSTGSNVLVAVMPAPGGMDLREIVDANLERAVAGTSFTFGDIRATELFGRDALSVETAGTIQGLDFEGEQTYLLVGDDLVVVNATIMSDDDRADIERVIEQLRLT